MRWLLMLALVTPTFAQKSFWVSVGVAATSQVFDAHSSWQKLEGNPVLGPRFDTRAVTIKSGVFAAVLLTELLTSRRHPKLRKVFTIVNFSTVGANSVIVYRNYKTQ